MNHILGPEAGKRGVTHEYMKIHCGTSGPTSRVPRRRIPNTTRGDSVGQGLTFKLHACKFHHGALAMAGVSKAQRNLEARAAKAIT